MESHIRVNITSNWIALQQLRDTTYKVLMCLAARADKFGRCFPSVERIAEDTNLCTKTVYQALTELVTDTYIKYLRKAHEDPLSGQYLHAVFQVSPFFLVLGEESQENALLLWSNTIGKIFQHNQQQDYVQEQATNNQPQETTTTTNNRVPEKESATAKSEKQNNSVATSVSSQRSLPNQNSAIVKKYTSVILIDHPLPDELSERLVTRMTTYQIASKLGRGLINHFGYSACENATNYMEFSKQFQDIRNPAGFIRDALETRLYEVDVQPRNDNDQFLES